MMVSHMLWTSRASLLWTSPCPLASSAFLYFPLIQQTTCQSRGGTHGRLVCVQVFVRFLSPFLALSFASLPPFRLFTFLFPAGQLRFSLCSSLLCSLFSPPQQTMCPRRKTHQVVTVLMPTPFGQSYTADCSKATWIEGQFIGNYTCNCLWSGKWQCPEWNDVCTMACVYDEDAQSANGIPLNTCWPNIKKGETATLPCPEGYTGTVSRTCGANHKWADVEGNCVKQGTVRTLCSSNCKLLMLIRYCAFPSLIAISSLLIVK